MEKAERCDKYWICDECATKKRWKYPDWPVTVTRGLCGHCDSPIEDTLTPVTDFKKGPGHKPVWD